MRPHTWPGHPAFTTFAQSQLSLYWGRGRGLAGVTSWPGVELGLVSPTQQPGLGHKGAWETGLAHLPNTALLLHVFAHNGPDLALGQQLASSCSFKVFIGTKLLQDSFNDANCLHKGLQWLVRPGLLGGQGQGEVGRLD